MKKFTIMTLLAGALFFTSACNSGQKSDENSDQNAAEDKNMVSPGQENLAANEAPTTSSPDACREMEVDNADTAMKSAGGAMPADEFVKEAASGGMMEVELGKMASQKAQNQQVKEFAQMMVNDHSKANQQLKSLVANKKGFTLPVKMMDKHQQHVDHLSKLSGSEFDKEYMAMMVKDHQEDVSKFNQASKGLSDAQVKSFAQTTLPVLQMHLEKAQQINTSMEDGSAKVSNQ